MQLKGFNEYVDKSKIWENKISQVLFFSCRADEHSGHCEAIKVTGFNSARNPEVLVCTSPLTNWQEWHKGFADENE